jgi:hypothetical protein
MRPVERKAAVAAEETAMVGLRGCRLFDFVVVFLSVVVPRSWGRGSQT